MLHDYEVSRKIWEGKVPIEFVLDADHIYGNPPKPYYVMVPRTSYLCLWVGKAAAHFLAGSEELALDPDSLWLEYNRTPLKMYYPVGVLFDIHKADDALPWRISVKTKNRPDGHMSVTRSMMESMFMQSIKEADFLKRKAAVINAMRSEEHKQLWEGVEHHRHDEFWSVNRRLNPADDEPLIHVPIRLYEGSKPFRQLPIAPSSASGLTTLESAVEQLSSLPLSSHRVISQGIEVPLDTPLLWLAHNLAYPDNFIHVVLLPK